uniref:Gamma carbonic anhydrase n=1 Tax=Tetraselmis chuii TaxID=63592 RepID=A0A7S1STA9_9CHLO|mmetsp:Transcript_26989/g.48071  ORF Transcript_26989/g.48071 Transcript_26989/m.48071 type:complete len:274 (+) Transcript_26989:95-916(+)|eukprot:CAMPEP_0177778586 /NCGR_PEP_ID=MMETSP0491_2-20121128/16039_1 /TAXON_ID=63592 /ORGANISM="Tetraselmis chuii, Strain PLY429" /LENGTH=273 /DNA_ID=CAMNT_0019297881 /DNA_START=89 /DNA_END=910 /DNA_ORIENTATION=-
MSATLGRTLGAVARGLGSVLEGVGVGLQGSLAYRETVTKQKPLLALAAKKPTLGEQVFVAPNACLIGDVTIGDKSSVFYGSAIRGDVNPIKIGSMTSIQDNVVIHVAKSNAKGQSLPTIVGSNCVIGQNAILHACTIQDGSLVGMGSTLMDGVTVEKGAIVGAGSMVTPGTTVPSGQIWAGNPAKLVRAVTAEEAAFLTRAAEHLSALSTVHLVENAKTFEEVLEEAEVREEIRTTDPDYYDHMGIHPPQGVETVTGPDGRVRVVDGDDPRLG